MSEATGNIHIPEEAVEAAAEADYLETFSAVVFSWAEAPDFVKDKSRARARAAILAALRAWPGMSQLRENDSASIREMAALILPLPQEKQDG